jgi:hypothetical protein
MSSSYFGPVKQILYSVIQKLKKQTKKFIITDQDIDDALYVGTEDLTINQLYTITTALKIKNPENQSRLGVNIKY